MRNLTATIKIRENGTYAGDYSYDPVTNTVKGCPARARNVKNLIKNIRTHDRK